ncbi:MAG: SidA/IucD/PvdA family monooxygenase [Solirubrobacterales bacterium]|nr:SidA/IucD/PvdA family monooxygenase [Solirubrobacterales bacterium]
MGRPTPRSEDVVIAGAGAAGLSVAAMLERRGIRPLMLEREAELARPWERRYESLRLNTPRPLSTMPGYRMPRRYGRWPTRGDMVEYLRDYPRRVGLRVEPQTEVTGLERDELGWRVRSSRGELRSRCVVVATGHDHDPRTPEWPGRETYGGELIHSSAYREPSSFRGRDVLVVSARNSGSEIALELCRSGAARVRVSMRTPPNVVPREWVGVPLMYTGLPIDPLPDRVGDEAVWAVQRLIYGDLARWGLPRSPVGVQTDARRRHKSTLIDAGFVAALKAGELELVAAVQSFDRREVVLADGARIDPDVVIAATGYRGGLEPLVGHLGVLDARGWPDLPRGGEHPAAAGLYFSGYWASMIGQLAHMRRDSRRIARGIARRLRR